MNAVVLTVKASYVASTKYRKLETKVLHKKKFRTILDSLLQVQQDTPPLVVWKMKAPEKKPLVRREAPEEVRAKVSNILVIRHIGKTA